MFVNQISGLVDSMNPAVSLWLFLPCPRSPLPRARPHLAANHPLLLTPQLPSWPCLPSPHCPPSWLCSRPFLSLLLCSIIPTFGAGCRVGHPRRRMARGATRRGWKPWGVSSGSGCLLILPSSPSSFWCWFHKGVLQPYWR